MPIQLERGRKVMREGVRSDVRESRLEPSILGTYRTTTIQEEWFAASHPGYVAVPGAPIAAHVHDVMTRNVISILKTATLREAVEVLSKHCITGIPVLDKEQRPVGVLSEKDVLRTLREAAGLTYPKSLWDLVLHPGAKESDDLRHSLLRALEENKVQNAMSTPPITIGQDVTLYEALKTMVEKGIHRLIVVDSGKMIGIVTRRDILASMVPGK